jgi:hypothetical protein
MLPKVPFRDESHVCSPSTDEGDHLKIIWKRLEPFSISITLDTYNHVLPNLQKGAVKASEDLNSPGLVTFPNAEVVGKKGLVPIHRWGKGKEE